MPEIRSLDEGDREGVVDRDKVGRILKGSEWAKFWGRPGAVSVLVCWEMQPT